MTDLLIRGAQVFDGEGGAARVTDVAVQHGRITTMGKVSGNARQVIDADGLALMPGIVDLHTHYDAQVTWDRTMSPSPALGVTTAVIGNCGFGIAPCPAGLRETMLRNLSVVEGMDLKALLAGVDFGFESFPQYMQQLRDIGPYLNTAVFAGHSVIRTAVMGEAASERATPSDAELARMRALVAEAMAAGAIGFASSFSPNHSGYGGRPMPSTIASHEELYALTDVLREAGRGVFMSATGSRLTPAQMEGIAQRTGRPAFISTVLAMYNAARPELCGTYYDACRASQARGHEVVMLTSCQPLSFDFALTDPYLLLSHSAFDAIADKRGDTLAAVYRDPAFRAQFRANLQSPGEGILFLGDWQCMRVARCENPSMAALAGRSVVDIAGERGVDPLDAFFDIALQDDLQTHFLAQLFQNHDEGVATLLKDPAGVITLSDAGAHLLYMCDAGFGLHMLSHWVRETGHFTLAEAVRRITSDPADRFRIPDRGRLAAGAPADMMLFDPQTIGLSSPIAVADLPGGGTRMVREPRGMHGVWVNGVAVHDGRELIDHARGPGTVLDRFHA